MRKRNPQQTEPLTVQGHKATSVLCSGETPIREMSDLVRTSKIDDVAVVYSSVCPHFGGPLEDHSAKGQVRCGWHGWIFDLRTGRCINRKVACRIKFYELEEVSDLLQKSEKE